MDIRAATFLKYRFGDLAQMNNHLHVVNGRTLFFYRDGRSDLQGGGQVVVELSLANSEQVTTLRGSVLARIDGDGSSGAWIEFPDSRLAKRIDQGGASSIASRHQRRLGCDLMVELKYGALPLLGRMVDVSLSGARVVGTSGLRMNSDLQVRIMGAQPPLPSQLGRAQVARSDSGGDVGLRFSRSDPDARVASGKLFHAVQQSWTKAPEVAHSPLCCQDGNVLEPPLPHMRLRA